VQRASQGQSAEHECFSLHSCSGGTTTTTTTATTAADAAYATATDTDTAAAADTDRGDRGERAAKTER
jgi:hypothetical protein